MFKVIHTYDGVADGPITALHNGTYEDCRNWIRNLTDAEYRIYTEGKFELDILDTRTDRLVSYVI